MIFTVMQVYRWFKFHANIISQKKSLIILYTILKRKTKIEKKHFYFNTGGLSFAKYARLREKKLESLKMNYLLHMKAFS